MTDYSYITAGVVRSVLEAGSKAAYSPDLKKAVHETFAAWGEDQMNEDLDGRAFNAREDAIIDLEDLDAYDIDLQVIDSSQDIADKIWNAIHKYWTN